LEEDPTLRQNVNIYRDKTKMPVDEDDEEGKMKNISGITNYFQDPGPKELMMRYRYRFFYSMPVLIFNSVLYKILLD
jgi:hypothetical protein